VSKYINIKIKIIALLTLLTFGCGGSTTDSTLNDPIGRLGTNTGDRVPHQNWGSYRLYEYDGTNWQRIIELGTPTGGRPALNERPVVIAHGLGSSIVSGELSPLAQNLLSNGATSVFGFEYDSLAPISENSVYFGQALQYLTEAESDRTFRVVGHSMGGLVARGAFESGVVFGMADSGNLVSFAATPHQGAEVADELVNGDSNIVDEAIAQLILNGELDFFNSNGQPVDVRGSESGIRDLIPNSPFLVDLNFDASANHPQFVYRTVAGTERGTNYEAFDRILGIFADDGIVNVPSANAQVIGPVATETVPFDHSTIVADQVPQLVILSQIGLLP
jgi:palmitoyl protein thioesterase